MPNIHFTYALYLLIRMILKEKEINIQYLLIRFDSEGKSTRKKASVSTRSLMQGLEIIQEVE